MTVGQAVYHSYESREKYNSVKYGVILGIYKRKAITSNKTTTYVAVKWFNVDSTFDELCLPSELNVCKPGTVCNIMGKVMAYQKTM